MCLSSDRSLTVEAANLNHNGNVLRAEIVFFLTVLNSGFSGKRNHVFPY